MPRFRRPQLALIALLAALVIGYLANAVREHGHPAPRPTATSASASATALSSLPMQATDTVRLIAAGGPFPYHQDGAEFANRERLLPGEPSGYYHEYTVRTPGSPDRGARRIVTGRAGEYWYTGDHYASLHRVDVAR